MIVIVLKKNLLRNFSPSQIEQHIFVCIHTFCEVYQGNISVSIDKMRLIISGVSSFLVGTLCGSLAGMCAMVVYSRWKKSRSNSPPPSCLNPLASPSSQPLPAPLPSLPLQAPPLQYVNKIDDVSDTAIYEDMDSLATTYTPKEQLQQNVIWHMAM